MGCCSCKWLDLREDLTEEGGYLPKKQRDIIRSTWKEFLYGAYHKDAIFIFVTLFQVHPETLELFSFIDKSTMQHPLHNERFMAHVDYVMADIGMMTDNLDDLPDVAIHMYNMGKRHAVRGVKAEYFKAFADGIMYALRRKLGSLFTDRAKTAWQIILDFSGHHFAHGLRDGEIQLNKGKTPQPKGNGKHRCHLPGLQSPQDILESGLQSAWDSIECGLQLPQDTGESGLQSTWDTIECGSQLPQDTLESGLQSTWDSIECGLQSPQDTLESGLQSPKENQAWGLQSPCDTPESALRSPRDTPESG
ncbi:hypothetical protein BaRGS_00018579 [Batillaria attramentaria]|uniref:Globin n=1 Tax=Batillaria attramentaria TaxID=370345 RepID=A0ABD0KSL8_9CAEN